MKKFRTETEQEVGKRVAEIFSANPTSVETKLENFPKYVRRQHLKRFLACYEIFQKVMTVKGSIVECGVFHGATLMTWAKLSAILEPENFTRRIYGFDTFEGFAGAAITEADRNSIYEHKANDLRADSYQELNELIGEFDRDRFLGHMDKVHLVKGNAMETIPEFARANPHLMVSLLFLDFDLFEPTKAAIETFMPLMPAGAIIAFDQLDNPMWPGETQALLSIAKLNKLKIQRLPWDPYIGYAIIGD